MSCLHGRIPWWAQGVGERKLYVCIRISSLDLASSVNLTESSQNSFSQSAKWAGDLTKRIEVDSVTCKALRVIIA